MKIGFCCQLHLGNAGLYKFTRIVDCRLYKICNVLLGIANLHKGNRTCMVFQSYWAMETLCYGSSLRRLLFQVHTLGYSQLLYCMMMDKSFSPSEPYSPHP